MNPPTPLSAGPRPASPNIPPLLDDAFDRWLSETTSFWGLKGVSIAVVRCDNSAEENEESWFVETKGYGLKNAAGDPVTENTTFAIGSNSKLFTALALGKLIEVGSTLPNSSLPFTWSTKIADILGDDWQLQDKVAERHANPVDLMSHRVGLPRHDLSLISGQTTAQALRKLRYLRPSEDFRDSWVYTNVMYNVMAEIVERVSGRPFVSYVQEEIMDPLGLGSTTMNSTKARTSGHLADGFVQIRRNVSGGEGIMNATYEPTTFLIDEERQKALAGGGGVTMSAKDAAVWLQSLLLNGRNPKTGEAVIPAQAIIRSKSGVVAAIPNPRSPELSVTVYGGAQAQFAYQGHNIIEHNGGWRGWWSMISRAPDDGLGIAVLTNWDDGAFVSEIVKWHLYEKAWGIPHIDWSSRFRANPERLSYPNSQHPIKDIPSHAPEEWQALIAPYLGTYHDPAYGTYELCPPPSSPRSLTPRCTRSDDYWRQVDSANVSFASQPAVIGIAISTGFRNYLRLVPTADSLTKFNMESFEITTSPTSSTNGNQPRSVVYPIFRPHGMVEFSLSELGVEGFGMTGVWGAPEPVGATVKERAEAWFSKIE